MSANDMDLAVAARRAAMLAGKRVGGLVPLTARRTRGVITSVAPGHGRRAPHMSKVSRVAIGAVGLLAAAGLAGGCGQAGSSGTSAPPSAAAGGGCAPVAGTRLVVLTDDKHLQNADNVIAAINAKAATPD